MKLPNDVILFSTADWDNPFWTNKQHTAARLAERGYRVLYVESIGLRKATAHSRDLTRILGRLKKGLCGLKKVQENIWVYSPIVIPTHGSPFVRRLNSMILCTQIRWYLWKLSFKNPILWTYNPLTIDLVGKLRESILIYHCVDDLTASPGIPVDTIKKAEEEMVSKADLVFTTNPKLQETRSRWNPQNTYYFPNVADYDHFSKAHQKGKIPSDLSKIPNPRIGFIGAISDYKIDFELISHIAKAREDWHWVMIGQVGEGQPETSVDLLKQPNIHLLGPKKYQELPNYLRGFDVAVLPCKINDYTSSMFPMKFFEYLAAGKPVVSTELPALRDYVDVCILAKSPDDFIKALDKMINGKVPDMKRCLELAKMHTWEKRLDRMEELLVKKWELKHKL